MDQSPAAARGRAREEEEVRPECPPRTAFSVKLHSLMPLSHRHLRGVGVLMIELILCLQVMPFSLFRSMTRFLLNKLYN